jgi:hypothetical protein
MLNHYQCFILLSLSVCICFVSFIAYDYFIISFGLLSKHVHKKIIGLLYNIQIIVIPVDKSKCGENIIGCDITRVFPIVYSRGDI